MGATLYLKWLLCFEEPEARTLWLGKATPREWLAAGGEPLLASGLTTRYGRISFAFHPPARGAAAFAVRVNVSLPPSFAAAAPAGGVRVRLRAPLAHAGRLSRVTVGGAAWAGFSAAEESIDFTAAQLTAGLLRDGLPRIVATFAAAAAAPLRPARAGPAHRVVATAAPANTRAAEPPAATLHQRGDEATVTPLSAPPPPPSTSPPSPPPPPPPSPPPPPPSSSPPPPPCPDEMTRVDFFLARGAAWSACEDLQTPGGALLLLSSGGEAEWFSKTYAPYGTNASDGEYYLGLNRSTLANATTDLLGAKLLSQELTWAAVARAAPPIRVSGRGGEWGTNCKGVRTFVGSRGAAYVAIS